MFTLFLSHKAKANRELRGQLRLKAIVSIQRTSPF